MSALNTRKANSNFVPTNILLTYFGLAFGSIKVGESEPHEEALSGHCYHLFHNFHIDLEQISITDGYVSLQ